MGRVLGAHTGTDKGLSATKTNIATICDQKYFINDFVSS